MHLTTFKLREDFQSSPAVFVFGTEHRKGDQHLVGMEPGIVASEIIDLRLLNGFDHVLRNELQVVVDAGQVFRGIEDQGGAGS